ncbi:hypothetical protein BX600DRAFT_506815 [Xylariales sp. PMI_506]|nr:hypothetical protein BX600DRAFT_506815 [Xylariales sp. PMI_506]
MPPRIPGVQRLGTFNLCLRPSPTTSSSSSLILPRTQTATLTRQEKKRMAKQEPYRWAQMKQRTAAHVGIKQRLAAERQIALGDPVRGVTVPFLESLDAAGQAPLSTPATDGDGKPIEEPHPLPTSPHILNYMVSRQELEEAVHEAYVLTRPLEEENSGIVEDPVEQRQRREAHERHHAIALEALARITRLDNGNAKDRRHANIRRCVETFGRHSTDLNLRPKALAAGVEKKETPVRGGPDTGSSEVQIAILTTKIRALANELERNRGYKDKMGKRNLRLLTHRRQRLLQYMERKERGSDRWHHMLQTLGLTPATWKGQITL